MKRKDYLAFGKPNFSEDEIDAVTRQLRSGWVGMGAETLAFEKASDHAAADAVVTDNDGLPLRVQHL